jgi:mannonate dehydratase
MPELFAAVREQFGPDLHLLLDTHHRLTPIEAARLAQDLEPYRLFWLEDTVPAEVQESFRLIRQKSVTPLAVGEIFNTWHDCRQLISEQLIDYIRMAASHAGGISHLLKVAHFAEPYHVRTACHGPSDISPIGLAANLHVGMVVNNFGLQEYMGYSETTEAVFSHDYSYRDGFIHLGDAPGLGIEFDESSVDAQPYDPAYLPVNRLEDGTMWNW